MSAKVPVKAYASMVGGIEKIQPLDVATTARFHSMERSQEFMDLPVYKVKFQNPAGGYQFAFLYSEDETKLYRWLTTNYQVVHASKFGQVNGSAKQSVCV